MNILFINKSLKSRSFQAFVVVWVMLSSFLWSCNKKPLPCEGRLESRYQHLYQAYHKAKDRYSASEDWPKVVRRFYSKECQLFEEAKKCQFSSPTIYNRWHRSRLKFPSEIQKDFDSLFN